MKKTRNQQISYAMRRLSKAVDRVILSTNEDIKQQATRWVHAWNIIAKKPQR
jgi:hypothetical protein